MKNVLLIAGTEERYYYDAFLRASERKNLRIYLFDPSRLPSQGSMSLEMDSHGQVKGFLDVLQCVEDSFVEARILISDIHVAWYLRENPRTSHSDQSMCARFVCNETHASIDSLMSVLTCPWVNRADRMHSVGSNKLYQQMMAAKGGLRIPCTVMSNDPHSVSTFAKQRGESLLKTIGYTVLDPNESWNIYAEMFSYDELVASAKAITSCPVYAQEYIPKRYEHRVMMIGSRVLACRIDSQASEKTRIDWRHYDFANVEHVQVELPLDVQKKLLTFMDLVDLKYGAVDLVETPDGEFVFLEINPSGQWGWIADLAGLPIPEAVAEMLATL
jgi:glutathione synthase/RimK-type ligase-like ATP-grasp enzyme